MAVAARRAIQAWARVLLASSVLSCALLPHERATGDRVVDGWPIGAPPACADAARCHALAAVAREGLEQHYAGHAEIVDFGLHSEGVLVDPETGNVILTNGRGAGG